MSRLRQVHKGLLEFSSFEEPDTTPQQPAVVPEPTLSSVKESKHEVAQKPALSQPMNEEDAILAGALAANEDEEEYVEDEYDEDEYVDGEAEDDDVEDDDEASDDEAEESDEESDDDAEDEDEEAEGDDEDGESDDEPAADDAVDEAADDVQAPKPPTPPKGS